MIPNEPHQTINTSGKDVRTVGQFRITAATQARMLISLSDKIYTKKELAVIREIGNNMADAQIEAKKPISDCIVTLPTMDALSIKFRDFGAGLTEEQLVNVFCVFGESTKRHSNEFNGTIGIGAKSPFSLTDSFTVTSWVNGEKSIYQCIKGDSTSLHEAILLSRSVSEEPCGIEVCVPIAQNSLWTFHTESANFFRHWNELPTIINMEDDSTSSMKQFRNNSPTLQGEGWNIRPKAEGTATGVAFMGNVPYHIDWNVLYTRMALTSEKRILFDLLQNNDVTLFFKMGEVQFVDSRESLEYTEFTFNSLTSKIDSIFARIRESFQEKFQSATNLWEAKKIYNSLFGSGILEVEKGENEIGDITSIKILDGNLSKLESIFKDAFVWNGIKIYGQSFHDIHRFDNAHPDEVHNMTREPFSPVMVTYRKKKSRVKINRCTSGKNHSILASDFVKVIINDTGKTVPSYVARYLILSNNSNIRTVHVLNFTNDTIRNNFYAEHNFDTVPVVKLSEILADAKIWYLANKIVRGTSSGASTTYPMCYMDMDDGKIKANDISLRDIEDGGYYIMESECRRRKRDGLTKKVMVNEYTTRYPGDIIEDLKTVIEKLGCDVDKVYIINSKVQESKWFPEAKASGDWINIWDYLTDECKSLDITTIANCNDYTNNNPITPKMATIIYDGITDKENSPMASVIKTILSNDYKDDVTLVVALSSLHLLPKLIGSNNITINYSELSNTICAQYPYISGYLTSLKNDGWFNNDNMGQMLKYINMADLYLKMVEKPAAMINSMDASDSDCSIPLNEKEIEQVA